MQRYDSYKDSGIQWLGEIPSHWEVCKLRRISRIVRGGSPRPIEDYLSEDGYNWIKIGDTIKGVKYITTTKQKIKKSGLSATRIVHAGDLILSNSMSFGNPYILKIDGCIHDGWLGFLELQKIEKEYLYYVLISESCGMQFRLLVDGGVVQNLNIDKVKDTWMPLPSIEEQQAIASYLDTATAKIDEAIAQQQKMIDLLNERKQIIINNAVTKGLNPNAKMKPSGIDWIGNIPEHWEIFKTLYALSMPITDGPHETPRLLESGIPFISAEAVSGGIIDFSHMRGYVSEAFYKECCKKYIPQLHDVYMIKSGATTGRTAIVETEDIFTIWSPLAVFRANKKVINPYFLLNALRATYYTKQVEVNWSYGTQQNIGMRILEKLLLCVPPLSEQLAIMKYIDSSIIPINKTIECAEEQISLLQERKQIIINDVVTGKVKII